MTLSSTVLVFGGSYGWGIPGGPWITVLDDGEQYTILRDGETVRTIATDAELDAFGAANQYPG